MSWTLVYTTQARKDAKKLSASGLRPKAEKVLEILRRDPFQVPPPFHRLRGDLEGAISRRINIQHRLVYQVLDEIKTVKVIRLWTQYDEFVRRGVVRTSRVRPGTAKELLRRGPVVRGEPLSVTLVEDRSSGR